MRQTKPWIRPSFWLGVIWIWTGFLLSLWISWHLLAKVDFFYPVWYDHAGIHENIERYAPDNHYREGFENTSRSERLALFHGIVESIQHQGKGLETLAYRHAGQNVLLLRPPEIAHLQDVANLVSWLNRAGLVVFGIWLLVGAWQLKRHQYTTFRQAWWFLGIGLGVIALLLALLGAEKVFYQLHVWVFPPEHPWFFFYEDSLMSTLMKAPDLFAYIAIALVVTAGLIFSLLLYTAQRVQTQAGRLKSR